MELIILDDGLYQLIPVTSDGTYIFIGTSRLHGPMRDTKIKTKRLRRHNKPAHYE